LPFIRMALIQAVLPPVRKRPVSPSGIDAG
jgi:hypothetical protein